MNKLCVLLNVDQYMISFHRNHIKTQNVIKRFFTFINNLSCTSSVCIVKKSYSLFHHDFFHVKALLINLSHFQQITSHDVVWKKTKGSHIFINCALTFLQYLLHQIQLNITYRLKA